MRGLSVALLLAAAVGLAGTSSVTLERLDESRSNESQLLYLPNGKHLRLASLGQSSLVADMIYLWAIQFYSDYEREDRFRYVEHVFGSVIAELDPHSVDTYWLGAMILSVEAEDLEGALRLLEKGFANNPEAWILPYLAGWECYYYGQPIRAASYFEMAKNVPDAPTSVRRMHAGMLANAGDWRRAIRIWQEVLDDPQADEASLKIARRRLRELLVRADLVDLAAVIGRFRNDNGRYPRRLDELRQGGYIRAVPVDPDGNPYVYDPQTGQLGSASGRVLGDS